jgi:hypothetical protein
MNIEVPKDEDILSVYVCEVGFMCGMHDGDENACTVSVGEPHKKKESMRARCTGYSNVKMDLK